MDLYCDPNKGLLGDFCPLLSVGDCTQIQGGYYFTYDHDLVNERHLMTIRATE